MKDQKSFSHKLADFIVENPKRLLVIMILFLAIFIPGLPKLQADFGYRIWFYDSDPLIVEFDKFEREFGNDDSIAIYIENKKGIFNKKTLNLVREMTQQMWNIKDVIGVDSLSNFQWTHSKDDDVIIENLIPNGPLSTEIIAERKTIAANHEVIPNYLMNKKQTVTMLFGKLKPFLNHAPNYKLIVDSTKDLVRSFREKYPDYNFYMNGMGVINDAFREVAQSDLEVMVPFLIIGIILLLIITFKNISSLCLTSLVIISTILLTFGFAGYATIKFNNIISMIPQILIAIAIADTVHLLFTYFQFRKNGLNEKEATREAYCKNIRPTFLTSLSTALGFISFSTADIMPIANMGYLAALGTMVAWLFTIFAVGPLMSLIPIKVNKVNKEKLKKKKDQTNNHDINLYSQRSSVYIDFISKYKKSLTFGFIIAFFVAIFIGGLNTINSNPFDYFSKKVPLRIANDFAQREIGGFIGPEISLDSGVVDGVKDPLFLQKVARLQSWIEKKSYVKRVLSIVDILKSMNRSFHNDDQNYYSVPKSKTMSAQLLFLYTMSLPQGRNLNDRISLNNQKTRMTVIWNKQKSTESLAAISDINMEIKKIGLTGMVTGKIPLYQRMNGHVVKAFISSISLAILLVGGLMIFIFKSWKIGILSMIPNIIPLGFGAALMTILNKPIDVGTVLVTSVCLGIAVDDTIHFLSNYYHYLEKGDTIDVAIKKVMTFTAPALVSTTIILVLSFGIFAFANFIPNVNFGILTALVLSSALIVDIVFLPALLLLLGNKKV